MQYLGTLQQKEIHYTASAADLPALKGTNWLALVVTQRFSAKTQGEMLAHLVAQEPLFVHCCCENAHDMEDAVADLLCEKYPGFDDDTVMPMTFADADLETSLRFCIEDAFHETQTIGQIVIIDLGDPFLEINVIKNILERL
jgi:hypothetical protein